MIGISQPVLLEQMSTICIACLQVSHSYILILHADILFIEKWIDRVVISGNPIPGCNGFGIEGILPNKAVIFGGYIDNEGDIYVSDNLYIIEVVIINEFEVEVVSD